MGSRGILYFLTNRAMPGLVKIGHTTGRLDSRIQQLNTTGIPSPFDVAATFYVSDCKKCEREVHAKLTSYRANPRREFFSQPLATLIRESIPVIEAYLAVSPHLEMGDVDPEAFTPDKDDIYFMFFLLHDGYEQGLAFSSAELAEHHVEYAPLEVELKLMNLQEHGLVKRVSREEAGLGKWQLLPKGLKFMFDGKHHAQDLIDESRHNF